MFPRTHGGIWFAFMNAPEQCAVESIVNIGRGEVCRRWNEFDSERTFAVDAMTTDAGVYVDFPPTDWISSLC